MNTIIDTWLSYGVKMTYEERPDIFVVFTPWKDHILQQNSKIGNNDEHLEFPRRSIFRGTKNGRWATEMYL
jgi:hypothetical protein